MNSLQDVNGVKLIISEVEISDPKILKSLLFQIGKELGEQVFLLVGSGSSDKAQLMLFISEDLVKSRSLHAGHIIKELARSIDGGGGGQAFFASAGGTQPSGLQDALKKGRHFIDN